MTSGVVCAPVDPSLPAPLALASPPAAVGRKVIHVDMDCFYAAVEERENPALRGRPLGVGGVSGRGVLTTANYAARAFGVHSAMPAFLARQRCPEIVLVPARFDLYRQVSAQVRAIFLAYTRLVEPLSLDEAYLDVSHLPRPATEVAAEIRARIRAETGLTASAGIAPNKMLAKVASDLRKPDGQCTIRPAAVAAFMRELPVGKIPGVGEVTAKRLADLEVQTCGQLQAFAREELVGHFGRFGAELFARCRGEDPRPVVPDRPRKSLSNENTFALDLESLTECQERLAELHADFVVELAEKEPARAVTGLFVKLRFADFSHTTVARAGRPPHLEEFLALLAEGWSRREPAARRVRLLGLGVRLDASERERLCAPMAVRDALQLALDL